MLNMSIALATLDFLQQEQEYVPWRAFAREMNYVELMLERTDLFPALKVSARAQCRVTLHCHGLDFVYVWLVTLHCQVCSLNKKQNKQNTIRNKSHTHQTTNKQNPTEQKQARNDLLTEVTKEVRVR